MKDRFSIRQATIDDAELISVLATTTFYEAYFEQDESANLASYIHESFEIENLRSEISDPASTFFLLFVDGKAVGYARTIAGSTLNCISASEKIIELKRIYLVERFWRAGAGKILLEHCINYAKENGNEIVWLGVWEENVRAHPFYKKFGFREVGTITFPYGDVVGTNLVLQKEL